MANNPLENPFREVNWRRKLTPAEEAELRCWLEGHPEARPDWEAERTLAEILGRLPDAPLPSNFTARVVRTAELELARAGRRRTLALPPWKLWMRWVPGATGAALALALGLISYEHFQENRRIEIVRSVATLSEVASLPSPQALEDFDAIHAMSQRPTADEELLRLLK